MNVFDEVGVFFHSPADAEADLDARTYRNSLEERLYRDGRKQVIDEMVAPIRDGAAQLMEGVQQDADDYCQEADELLAQAQALRGQIKRREIPAREGRKAIAKLNKEAERLAILAGTLPNDYAKALYDRDHPRDVLDLLFKKYPVGPVKFPY